MSRSNSTNSEILLFKYDLGSFGCRRLGSPVEAKQLLQRLDIHFNREWQNGRSVGRARVTVLGSRMLLYAPSKFTRDEFKRVVWSSQFPFGWDFFTSTPPKVLIEDWVLERPKPR